MRALLPKKKGCLTKDDAERHLQALSGWHVNATHSVISKIFISQNFIQGLAFIAKIAVHAEVLGHHPDIELSYGKVVVKLTTHDAEGLTKKDFELAERIEGLRQER